MKNKYILEFDSQIVNKPLIYELIKKYDIEINILKAEVKPGRIGHILVEFNTDNEELLKEALNYLKEERIKITPLSNYIHFKSEKCVHCGACTAVCFSNALVINKETQKLEFFQEKCIVCKLCTEACPLKLFNVNF